MAESFSVKAILSATDKGFSSTLKNAMGVIDSLSSKITSGIGFGILTGIGQQAFSSITSGVSDLIGEVNDANASWKTFAKNMSIIGKGADEIDSVKKELQDFATQTIYSASDMATTYAQLAAVGVDNTTELVKGFGGLAAAAENPQQAMKTLSQQATQMAAKPTVAWADFKLMLEQTPAGIAAVAKEMGMSTSDLVMAVQGGTVATEDFFKAITKAGGTGTEFEELATTAKTVDQAVDSLKETLSTKLGPAFDVVTQKGIGFIDSLSDKVGGIDSQGLADKVETFLGNVQKYIGAAKTAFDGVGTEFLEAFNAIRESLTGITGEFGSVESVTSFHDLMTKAADALKKFANFAEEHSDGIARLIKMLPALVIGFKGFQIVKTLASPVAKFASSIGSLAGKGISAIAGKLFGIAAGEKAAGKEAKKSNKSVLESAKAFMMIGAAVLMVSAGLALLTYSAIQLAAAGPLAIGVMFGLVGALVALGAGMAVLLKTLAPMSAQLVPVATAMLGMGAAVLLVAAGFALLAYSAIQLANSGGVAIAVMFGMIGAIAGLMAVFAILGPVLSIGAVGMLAFGAAVLMVGAGVLLACAGLTLLATQLPIVVEYGAQAAVTILQLSGALLAFSAGALAGGAGALTLGAGVLVATAGILAFGAGMTVAVAGTLLMKAALVAVGSSMKGIAKNAKATQSALTDMRNSISVVESGLDALGSKAKSAMKKLKSAFDDTASEVESSGKKVGTGFADGMQSGLSKVSTIARTSVTATNNALMSGRIGAYNAGAYISLGFAQGMQSQLRAVESAAAKMAQAAEKAVRAKAQIHSPSKVSTKLGQYWGKGYVGGLLDMVKDAWNAALELVSVPQMATPNLALAYGGELSADYEYSRNAEYVIEVPLSVDGREFAKATASYTEAELNKKASRDSRKLGKV